MKCPDCGSTNTKCIDSRSCHDDEVQRRRLECKKCSYRFTSYEFSRPDGEDLFIHIDSIGKETFTISKGNSEIYDELIVIKDDLIRLIDKQ